MTEFYYVVQEKSESWNIWENLQGYSSIENARDGLAMWSEYSNRQYRIVRITKTTREIS